MKKALGQPAWAYKLFEEHARKDLHRAVELARCIGRRQEIMVAPDRIEDDGIHIVQLKTGKEPRLPLHADLSPT